jgi:uncharacterized membrane protein
VALALVALAGIGVTIFATISAQSPESHRQVVASLARQRAVAYSSGLLYMLAAALVHFKTFFDLQRGQITCRRAAQLLLAAHGLVAAAVLYSFAVQRLTSRALLVGLDALLSSTAILSVLACVVCLAMLTQIQLLKPPHTRQGLWRAILFTAACMLFAGSLLWLENSPLP